MPATKPTVYLETHSQDPAYNLAFEETVLKVRKDRPYLLLWQNDNTIVVGQNQNTAAEIDPDFVEAHHIHVVRRITGGGAVYHDLGNLNYSFLTDVDNAADMTYQQFTRPVVEALQGLGLQAEASGRNDILVEGRKVSVRPSVCWASECSSTERCSLIPISARSLAPFGQIRRSFSLRAHSPSVHGWETFAPF